MCEGLTQGTLSEAFYIVRQSELQNDATNVSAPCSTVQILALRPAAK